MTKSELIKATATATGETVVNTTRIVNALFDEITNALAAGEKITIVGFGTFDVRERAGRMGINPRTGEPLRIDAKKTPAFKASSALKNIVRGNS